MKATFTPTPEPQQPIGLLRDEAQREIGIYKRVSPDDEFGPEYLLAIGDTSICIYINQVGELNAFKTSVDPSYADYRFVPVSGTITLVSDTK